jgi:4-hydroxy-4-methyl-2-oxoglutarate aldolase
VSATPEQIAELARLGSATVYEAGGRGGYVDADLYQAVPRSRAAGPARTVVCGQDDNLMVHAVMAEAQPVALLGDLLATQAQAAGVAAILIDASIRDAEELAEMGLPIWSRWVRVKGAEKSTAGEINIPVTVGGATINPGDIVVLDSDGVAIVPADQVVRFVTASQAREEKERVKREKLRAGEKSYELDGLRAVVEAQR